jgi:phospholipid-binding lipoprotein MlaA
MNKNLFALALVASLCGCASVAGSGDPRDPIEGVNRQVYKFNDTLDRAVLKPVAQGYVKVVPNPVRTCVTNVFANLGDVWSAANSFLQNRAPDGINSVMRVMLNTTMGVGGCFDLATKNGAPRVRADFGQTLGVWGIGNGPYLVLPLFGPSTLRDAGGTAVDFVADPLALSNVIDNVPVRNSLAVLKLINIRANLLQVGNLLNDVALDSYAFTRDAYLQRRNSLVQGAKPDADGEGTLPDYGDDSDAKAPAGKPSSSNSVPATGLQ